MTLPNDTQTIDAGALRARLAETPADDEGKSLQDEVDELHAIVARQADILTGVANALRGEPAPLASHSHHDLADRAAAMVALLAVTRASLEAASSGRRVTACDEIERLQREIATLRASYAQDLDGLRAEVRRADDERATWRDLRDAAREYLDAGHAERCALADAMESPDDGLGKLAAEGARLDAARTRLAALVGGAS